MANTISIFGAGGHTRSLALLLDHSGYLADAIYDESYIAEKNESIFSIPVLGKPVDCTSNSIVLSYGSNEQRSDYYRNYHDRILPDNLIHPTAFLERSINIGQSNQIFGGVIINGMCEAGYNNIINTRALIEHEVIIGNHNHISIGSILSGRVKIGSYCFIGAGAVVIDKVKICDNVTIGANSVVIKDIAEPGVYVGNPVRKVK